MACTTKPSGGMNGRSTVPRWLSDTSNRSSVLLMWVIGGVFRHGVADYVGVQLG